MGNLVSLLDELCILAGEKGEAPEPIPQDCPNAEILNSLRALH
ncbi:hypothetical protein [Thioclava marina]|nr:hypothetical protein [Thioclava marina]